MWTCAHLLGRTPHYGHPPTHPPTLFHPGSATTRSSAAVALPCLRLTCWRSAVVTWEARPQGAACWRARSRSCRRGWAALPWEGLAPRAGALRERLGHAATRTWMHLLACSDADGPPHLCITGRDAAAAVGVRGVVRVARPDAPSPQREGRRPGFTSSVVGHRGEGGTCTRCLPCRPHACRSAAPPFAPTKPRNQTT